MSLKKIALGTSAGPNNEDYTVDQTNAALTNEQAEELNQDFFASKQAGGLTTDQVDSLNEMFGLAGKQAASFYLNVRNKAQVVLFEEELKGQISDGMWEDSKPSNHWMQICSATAKVGQPLGPVGFIPKRGYMFSHPQLIDIVGDRMIEAVQQKADLPNYNKAQLLKDLRDLQRIVRGEFLNVPTTDVADNKELRGKVVVLTGKPPQGYQKAWFADAIKKLGGTTEPNFTSRTQVVVYNPEQDTAKAQKARDYGITLIPYSQLLI